MNYSDIITQTDEIKVAPPDSIISHFESEPLGIYFKFIVDFGSSRVIGTPYIKCINFSDQEEETQALLSLFV